MGHLNIVYTTIILFGHIAHVTGILSGSLIIFNLNYIIIYKITPIFKITYFETGNYGGNVWPYTGRLAVPGQLKLKPH